jgi:hypothetical protein
VNQDQSIQKAGRIRQLAQQIFLRITVADAKLIGIGNIRKPITKVDLQSTITIRGA